MMRAYMRNVLLAVVLAAVLIVMLLVETFSPASILPPVNIPNLIGLCALVLMLDCWLNPDGEEEILWSGAMAFVTFFLLGWASGMDLGAPVWKIALVGAVVFGGMAWLFRSIAERIRSGRCGNAALVVTAFGLFLAGQCFTGIIL